MKKYAIVINDETKACDVGLGNDVEYYVSIGMTEQEVEEAYNGQWYLKGYAPDKPLEEIKAERISELKTKLAETDYVVIKIAEGEATRDDYEDVLNQRQAWRNEINELEV